MKVRVAVDVPIEKLLLNMTVNQLIAVKQLIESRLASFDGSMDVSEFEQGLLRLGRKIHAIKAYNERTGVGLVTAKRTVDAAWERLVELGDIS